MPSDKSTNPPPASRKLPAETEIAVLEALVAQGETLVATVGEGAPAFRSRLRLVDPGREFVLIESSGDAAADAALLDLPRVNLHVEWGEWRIEFAADSPKPVSHDGAGMIRLSFPEEVSVNRRRMLPRAPVPPRASLRCTAPDGAALQFDATLTDIGQGGISMLLEPPMKVLEPGTILLGCHIEGPGRAPVMVDLEVRHAAMTRLADGRQGWRIGCKFLNFSPEMVRLIADFFGKP